MCYLTSWVDIAIGGQSHPSESGLGAGTEHEAECVHIFSRWWNFITATWGSIAARNHRRRKELFWPRVRRS